MLAAKELNEHYLLYIHLCEADWDDAPQIPIDFRTQLRKTFYNTIIATGNKTLDEAEKLLQDNLLDLIGFGRNFLTNPDYPTKMNENLPLNEISDTHTLFGGWYW
jgi:N-ethylmaleimide reductase